MSYTNEELDLIWEKTNRRCHICRKTIARVNYGTVGRRGSWEVDHSNPRAKGGTDRFSNLLPACVSCNRSKRDGDNRSVRAAHGYRRRPLSAKEAEEARTKNVLAGAAAGSLAGGAFMGPPGAVGGALLGLAVGYLVEVEK